jgi:hypothetical protein
LYEDQNPDFVLDAIPATLFWLMAARDIRQAYKFDVEVKRSAADASSEEALLVTWDMRKLSERDATLADRVRRMKSGATPHREHLTEVAA